MQAVRMKWQPRQQWTAHLNRLPKLRADVYLDKENVDRLSCIQVEQDGSKDINGIGMCNSATIPMDEEDDRQESSRDSVNLRKRPGDE